MPSEFAAMAGRGEGGRQTRLSVNLSHEAAEFLDNITKRQAMSYTEAIRRALAIYKLIDSEISAGHIVQIDTGNTVRQVVLP